MEGEFEFTESKARIHLRKDPTEISFSFFSDLPRRDVLAFLGLFLRSRRESNQDLGRVYPITPPNTVLLTVRYLEIEDKEGKCYATGGEGHIFASKGMTRNFPAILSFGNTEICFKNAKSLRYSLFQLFNDFYIYTVENNGNVVEIEINGGMEEEKVHGVEQEEPPMQTHAEIEAEEDIATDFKPIVGMEEEFGLEKEKFDADSEFRALQSTNASENALILQTEIGKIKEQNKELSGQVSTLQTQLEEKDQRINNLERQNQELSNKLGSMEKNMAELKNELSKLYKEKKPDQKEKESQRSRHHEKRKRGRSTDRDRDESRSRSRSRSGKRNRNRNRNRSSSRNNRSRCQGTYASSNRHKDQERRTPEYKEREREKGKEKLKVEQEQEAERDRDRERHAQRKRQENEEEEEEEEEAKQQRLQDLHCVLNDELSPYVIDEWIVSWNKKQQPNDPEKHTQIKICTSRTFIDLMNGRGEYDVSLLAIKYLALPIVNYAPNKVHWWGLSIIVNPHMVSAKPGNSASKCNSTSDEQTFKAFYLDSCGYTKLKPASDLIATYLIAIQKKSHNENDPNIVAHEDGSLKIKTDVHHQSFEEKFISSQKESNPNESGILMLQNLQGFLSNPQRFVFEYNNPKGFGRKERSGSLQTKRQEIYEFLTE